MKAIVTGGLGFIGSEVVRKLENQGDEVTIVDDDVGQRGKTGRNQRNILWRNCAYLEGLSEKADMVFHFGSKSSILHYFKDPAGTALDTIAGWKGVLDYCKTKGSRLVAASSATVYGTAPLPQREDGPTYPVNTYSIGKLLCERMTQGIDAALLRPFTGYGPGEMRKTWYKSPVGMFIDDALSGRPFTIYGDGTQTRDFIYIDDLAEAIIRIAESDHTGPINIGTGIETSMNRLAEVVEVASGHICGWQTSPKFETYVDHMKADTTLFKKVTRMEPIKIEEGVRKFLKAEADQHIQR